jgi:hypothetical protein
MKAGDLLEVERQIGVLDSSYPVAAPLWTNELILLGCELMKPGGGTYGGPVLPRSALWRFGYSTKIAAADAFFRADEQVRNLVDTEDRPWSASRLNRGWVSRSPNNPLYDQALRRLPTGPMTNRFVHVVLRLLRVAAHFRATGEWIELADPLGDTLKHKVQGNALRAWSVGPDGVDDGGQGEWDPFKGKDIELEVER